MVNIGPLAAGRVVLDMAIPGDDAPTLPNFGPPTHSWELCMGLGDAPLKIATLRGIWAPRLPSIADLLKCALPATSP